MLAPLFVGAVFASAALVFLLEPMVAKLLLPRLGGSAAVWNTSMLFFQAALLAGYAYAHWLQRLRSLQTQTVVHVLVLLGALAFLPLRIFGVLGDPSPNAPIPWLLAVLTISVGFPFAALSATAPLLQRWYGLLGLQTDGAQTYWLYGASNLGSFVALIAYPTLVEPHVSLSGQRVIWSAGFVIFAALVATLAIASRPISAGAVFSEAPVDLSGSWRERIVWMFLTALPSSLMLGVTTYLVTDVASAPFLWAVPLALYLVTFVIAFAKRPPISLTATLIAQAALVAITLATLPFGDEYAPQPALFALHLATFFFTALACHQTLVARRPSPERSTEFFLAIAGGGMLGGAFNALFAPVLFKTVVEYPLALVVATLVRPWGSGALRVRDWGFLGVALALAIAAASIDPVLDAISNSAFAWLSKQVLNGGDVWSAALLTGQVLLGLAALVSFALRSRAWPFAVALGAISIGASHAAQRERFVAGDRGFFGVLRMEQENDDKEGQLRLLYSGTTLHGVQVVDRDSPLHCRPMLYYAPATPIGQVVRSLQRTRPALDVGVVGLGTGTLAAYVRKPDTLSYFEIDPKVLGFAFDRARFGYVSDCAKGKVRIVLGDARLTISREATRHFDLLVVDAFTSDSVPTHLLTEQAFRTYLRVLKPGGLVLLHLSNRNLELLQPAAATAAAIGAPALQQWYVADAHADYMAEADVQAIVFARTREALRDLAKDARWDPAESSGTAPWTDDYSDVFGAVLRKLKE